MKTLQEMLKQEPVFLNDWKNIDEVMSDFNGYTEFSKKYSEMWNTINILFASYGCACYEGDAYVLFEKDGSLYEVFGSHCSCYGLEGQFDEELVSLESLEYKLLNGTFGESDYTGNTFKESLCKFLGVEYIQNNKY